MSYARRAPLPPPTLLLQALYTFNYLGTAYGGFHRAVWIPELGDADWSGATTQYRMPAAYLRRYTRRLGPGAAFLDGQFADAGAVIADADHCLVWALIWRETNNSTIYFGRGADGFGAGWSMSCGVGSTMSGAWVVGGTQYANSGGTVPYRRWSLVSFGLAQRPSLAPSEQWGAVDGAALWAGNVAGSNPMRSSTIGYTLGGTQNSAGNSSVYVAAAGVMARGNTTDNNWGNGLGTAFMSHIQRHYNYAAYSPPHSRRFMLPLLAAPAGTLKTANGLADASIKTVNGLARASIKTLGGLTP